jgi:CRISPR/Cas system CMR-associated protein Cmr3 (group 5 of RAMP superfamily)
MIWSWCFIADALVPSSLETFSTCVDREEVEVDEEKVDESENCNVTQEKKVVIKLDDSDIEENRGEKQNYKQQWFNKKADGLLFWQNENKSRILVHWITYLKLCFKPKVLQWV